jgi:uncharacterized protein (TIGR02466 family)
MIREIFPLKISTTTIDVDWNRDEIMTRLAEYFEQQKQDGIIVRTLHKEKVFAPLLEYMNRTVAEYWLSLDYDPSYPVEMSQMWANMYGNAASYPHNLESDSPAIVTVVFYVDKNSAEEGNLFFADPNELLLQTQPLNSTRRYDPHSRYFEFDGRTGDLVCFPSWVQHGIYPNLTDRNRISIAGNYELKGLANIKKFMSK